MLAEINMAMYLIKNYHIHVHLEIYLNIHHIYIEI
jgi:hypothetical protein